PWHIVLPQHLASIVYAAMWLQAQLYPQHATRTFEYAFKKWAWNITTNGNLNDVPSLTPVERQHW
ncbi:hypothetical protein CC86DRAFT_246526, partial [Ophiobolus disseminans]